ncbi:2-oxoacid:acceptor oxidoreductase family protein, partial [Arthrospira platensis SPKY1]|nr:2-oxoacid:acceptor oxidoreductase family protein [Arthrospira platensis SPKY1]
FTDRNLERVGYIDNPCNDESFTDRYRVYSIPISRLTKEALKDSGLSSREVERCKNFFTLGVMLWMFNRPTESTKNWIDEKFAKSPQLASANHLALTAGMTYAEATEIFEVIFEVQPAQHKPGTYRNLNGTVGASLGLVA